MCGDLFFFLLFHFGVVDELFAETFQFARCQGVAQKIHKSVVCFCFHSCRVLRVDAFVSFAKIKNCKIICQFFYVKYFAISPKHPIFAP